MKILYGKKNPPPRHALTFYDYAITSKVTAARGGGENSFHQNIIQKPAEIEKNPNVDKPLEQWTYADFRVNGCIYCINNGGYRGPLPLTTDEYERHIVMKHKDRPDYPGPADIEKYGLNLNGHDDEKAKSNVSKLVEIAEANESGNGVMFGNESKDQTEK